MKIKTMLWTAALAVVVPMAVAQSNDTGAKQDMKNAGSDVKSGTKSAGRGIEKGTKTGYHKTVNGTKKGYHKTAHATKTGIHKVEGKPNTPANNPPQ